MHQYGNRVDWMPHLTKVVPGVGPDYMMAPWGPEAE